jgi:hypothetical protein
VIYRKGELSKSTINRDWPHQLVLPADFVRGRNYAIIDRFCRDLSLCPPTRSPSAHQRRYREYSSAHDTFDPLARPTQASRNLSTLPDCDGGKGRHYSQIRSLLGETRHVPCNQRDNPNFQKGSGLS